jgi:hypothetical protein
MILPTNGPSNKSRNYEAFYDPSHQPDRRRGNKTVQAAGNGRHGIGVAAAHSGSDEEMVKIWLALAKSLAHQFLGEIERRGGCKRAAGRLIGKGRKNAFATAQGESHVHVTGDSKRRLFMLVSDSAGADSERLGLLLGNAEEVGSEDKRKGTHDGAGALRSVVHDSANGQSVKSRQASEARSAPNAHFRHSLKPSARFGGISTGLSAIPRQQTIADMIEGRLGGIPPRQAQGVKAKHRHLRIVGDAERGFRLDRGEDSLNGRTMELIRRAKSIRDGLSREGLVNSTGEIHCAIDCKKARHEPRRWKTPSLS